MTKKLNVYHILFAAFLTLKLGHVGEFAGWGWFWVVLPMIIGTIHSFVVRLLDNLGLPDMTARATMDMYLTRVRKRETKKEFKRLQKLHDENTKN